MLLCCALLGACSRKPPQETEAEPDPSAWLAPPDAAGLAPAPDEPDESAPGAKSKPDSDGIVAGPVRKVRPKDMPPMAPAPTERSKDPAQSSIRAVMGSYGFPAHESLQHLCAGRLIEPGGKLTWDAFSSSQDPAALLVSYRGQLGETGFSAEKTGGRWSLPPKANPPLRELSVLSAGEGGPHRGCKEQVPGDAKSVIIVRRRE